MGILNTYTQVTNATVLLSDLNAKSAKIAVVGLQGEGLEMALHLATTYRVIGYDHSRDYTRLIQQQKDPIRNNCSNRFIGKDFFATSITNILEAAQLFIITTVVGNHNELKKSVVAVAKHLKVGDVVVFQGNTNSVLETDYLVSVLERISGLLNGVDFTIAFLKRVSFSNASNQFISITKSANSNTRKLVDALFQNIPVLTVVKAKTPLTTNAIANKIVEKLKEKQPNKKRYSVLLKGITSAKNSNELKNSKAVALYMALYRKGIQVKIQDNHVLPSKVEAQYGIELTTSTSQRFDAIVLAVAHDNYMSLTKEDFKKNSNSNTIIFDKLYV